MPVAGDPHGVYPAFDESKHPSTLGLTPRISQMSNRPGGELAKRPLQFIWLCDCSGSMSGKKIESLKLRNQRSNSGNA